MIGRRPVVAVLALLVLTGCTDGNGGEPRVVVQTQFLDRLSAAIDKVNAARADLAGIGSAISTAAAALNDVDDVAVEGDRSAVRERRPAAAKAMAKASPGARRLTKAVGAYRTAIDTLDKAPTTGLDAAQRGAIDAVVTATRTELGKLDGYVTVIASIWPRYEAIDETQKLWLARSSNGWYRDQQEAAGAYVTMADRKGLAKDGTSLANADRRRIAAAQEADRTIAAASGALASLLG